MRHAAILFAAAAILPACRSVPPEPVEPPSPMAVWEARRFDPDSIELERMALDWWSASISRDRAYFERVLAPEFVWRKFYHNGADMDRQRFIEWEATGGECGYSRTYQVQFSHTRVVDSVGIVTQLARTWIDSAPEPMTSQLERLLTLVAIRRGGTWMFVEGRPLEYQLDASAWAWPDTGLSYGPDSPTNPVEPARTIVYPSCGPPKPPPPPPPLPLPEPGVRITVLAIDSTTGEPIRRPLAFEHRRVPVDLSYSRYVEGDTLGRIVFDSVRSWPITIGCLGKERWTSPSVARLDSAMVMRASAGPVVVAGDGSRCDQRPLTVLRGPWSGIYRGGFEQSDLELCGDTAKKIWVTWTEAAYAQARRLYARAAKPEVDAARHELSGMFMKVVGTLRGPGKYGHLGGSSHELTVDSVLRYRPRRASDCR